MKGIRKILQLTFVTLILIAFYSVPRLFKINKIICTNQYGVCGDSYSQILDKSIGEKLPEAKRNILGLLNTSPTIEDFSLHFKFPDTLQIDMIEKKPRFALFNENLGKYALVNDTGQVLSIRDENNLPFVVIDKKLPNVGDTVTHNEKFALDIIFDIYKMYQVDKGAITDGSLAVNIKDNNTAIFPLEGDRQVLVGSLSLIVSRLNRLDKDPKIGKAGLIIDLRYKNPVIR